MAFVIINSRPQSYCLFCLIVVLFIICLHVHSLSGPSAAMFLIKLYCTVLFFNFLRERAVNSGKIRHGYQYCRPCPNTAWRLLGWKICHDSRIVKTKWITLAGRVLWLAVDQTILPTPTFGNPCTVFKESGPWLQSAIYSSIDCQNTYLCTFCGWKYAVESTLWHVPSTWLRKITDKPKFLSWRLIVRV